MRVSGNARSVARAVLVLLLIALAIPLASHDASAFTESPSGPLGYFPLTTPVTLRDGAMTGGLTQVLTVKNQPGVLSSTVTSAVMQIKVTNPSVAGSYKLWETGQPEPSAISGNYTAGQTTVEMMMAKLNAGGQFSFHNLAPSNTSQAIKITVIGYYGSQNCDFGCWAYYENRFQVSTMQTILDHSTTPMNGGDQVTLQIVGHNGVGSGAAAKSATFHLSILPVSNPSTLWRELLVTKGDEAPPSLSPTTFHEGDTLSRMLTVDLSSTGTVQVKAAIPTFAQAMVALGGGNPNDPRVPQNEGARIAFRMDIAGWTDVAGVYHRATKDARSAQIDAGTTLTQDVRGYDGVPSKTGCVFSGQYPDSCVEAVQMTITATSATADGTISVGGVDVLATSAGRKVSNTAIIPVPAGGLLDFTWTGAAGSSVHYSYEITGWFEHSFYDGAGMGVGSRYTPIAPTMLYGSWWCCQAQGWHADLQVAGVGGVPNTGAAQVALQLTAWWVQGGNVNMTVWPSGRSKPAVPQLSAVNNGAASTVVMAEVGKDGKVSVELGDVGSAAVTISVLGWYTPFFGTASMGANTNIAIIGDSITALSMTTVAAENNDTHKLNILGQSGFQAREMKWWADVMGNARPDGAIVNLGTNDAWLGADYPASSTKDDIATMFASMPTSACSYAVTINDTGIGVSNWYTQRATAINDALVPFDDASPAVGRIDWSRYVHRHNGPNGEIVNNIDGVHPTALGVTMLAQLYAVALTGTGDADLEQYVVRCGASIAGRATVSGGAAAPDAVVKLYDTSSNVVATTSTDTSGRYALGGLAAGNYRIGFEKQPTTFYGSKGDKYVMAYWPNSSTLSGATQVTISGSTSAVTGRDIVLAQTP
jgi:hypothetical protein